MLKQPTRLSVLQINLRAAVASLLMLIAPVMLSNVAQAERIKDIAMVEGARTNQLIGYGLVVGLDGTGDQVTQTPFTIQAARSMLQQFGVNCRRA